MKTGFSITKARKVLGKLANGVTDDQIQNDIDIAIVLKDMFFEMLVRQRKKASKTSRNVP